MLDNGRIMMVMSDIRPNSCLIAPNAGYPKNSDQSVNNGQSAPSRGNYQRTIEILMCDWGYLIKKL